jgi:hypothetical protein
LDKYFGILPINQSEQTVSDLIRIESLIPQPFPDLRRVSLNLYVSGLPPYGHSPGSNLISFFDKPQSEERAEEEKPIASPATPNVDLFPEALPSSELPGSKRPMLGGNRPSSPYPDLTLSILDQYGNEVATAFIIEHKEPELDFTLHLRAFDPGATYMARAEMTLKDEVIQVVQVPFELE